MLVGDNPNLYAKVKTIRCDTYCGFYKGDKGANVSLMGMKAGEMWLGKGAIVMSAGIGTEWYIYLQKLIKAGILLNQNISFMNPDLNVDLHDNN